MADKNTLSQMLEHLVNDEQQKAEELFHEYVVTRSREIYQDLIESEISEEDEEDKEEKDEEVDEASVQEEDSEEDLDEVFDEIAAEADDEEDEGGPDMTGDLEGEIDAGDDMGDMDDMNSDDLSDESEEDLFQDLDAIVDELQSRFDELKGNEMGDMGDEMKDDMDLETVREYVEKVPAGHGAEKKGAAEKSDSTKSLIDNMKNDMGGTTANILSGRNGADAGEVGAAGGKVKGSALSDTSAKEDNASNINVPGGKAGSAFTKKEPGHGAEKKGAAENAESKQSLFRGRR
jgi:hypothetical protein